MKNPVISMILSWLSMRSLSVLIILILIQLTRMSIITVIWFSQRRNKPMTWTKETIQWLKTTLRTDKTKFQWAKSMLTSILNLITMEQMKTQSNLIYQCLKMKNNKTQQVKTLEKTVLEAKLISTIRTQWFSLNQCSS